MKISYNWLKQFIKIDLKSEETATLLTDLGLEVEVVEKFETIKGGLNGVVVGKVLSCEKHPNADKLKVTKVDIGAKEPLQIVCGAPNVAVDQKVPVATIGTVLYDKDGKPFTIKKGKIRDVESFGMICAEDELGLGESHDGILVLDSGIEVGTLLSKVYNIESDEVFEIGLTPNRADAMSHYGVARDLRAGLIQKNIHLELTTPSVSKYRLDKRTLKIDVNVDDSKQTPRYCGVTISGLTVKPSPMWLQNRLKAIGLTPKNNIVDATNYVLHEFGQPLHAFDALKIIGNKIFVKNAEAGTKFTTLDDVERTLHEDDLMICDKNGPMCFAGVFGGKNSGVTENTTSIFLESAYFNPIVVRKMAKRHGLSTDASFRFERGIDPNLTEYALRRAALLIIEIAGGELSSDLIDLYPKKIEDHTVFLNFENTAKLIGQQLSKDVIKNILASLDIKVNHSTEIGLGLIVPAYRVDVLREVDVIEEILRVYGYNNIQFSNKLNATVSNSSRFDDYKIQNIIANQLVSLGFNEIMSNSLTTPDYTAYSENLDSNQNVMLLNALSKDLSAMRQSMLFSGLEAISYNINRKKNDLKLFEFGKTYHKNETYDEQKHLSLFVTGNKQNESWTNPAKATDFYLFKGYILSILSRLGIENTKHQPTQNDFYSEGISLSIGNSVLVHFGSIKQTVLKHFDIKQEVFYADFNWIEVLKIISKKVKFTDIPKYPEVRRDLALLIDEKVEYETIYNLAKTTEKKLLKNINLFDVYKGKNLPEGKKSYALSFIIQDESKTLTTNEVDAIMSKLQTNFEQQLGAVIR